MAETTTTRRRELPEVRREQILDAAAQVFLDRGLAEATMAEVAEAAGWPRAPCTCTSTPSRRC
jgi:AcrR family transcriptional regulator